MQNRNRYRLERMLGLRPANSAEANNPHANSNNPTLRRLQQINTSLPLERDGFYTNNSTQQFPDPTPDQIEHESRFVSPPRLPYASIFSAGNDTFEIAGDDAQTLAMILVMLKNTTNITNGGNCVGERTPLYVNKGSCYPDPERRSIYSSLEIDACGDVTPPYQLIDNADKICAPDPSDSGGVSVAVPVAVGFTIAATLCIMVVLLRSKFSNANRPASQERAAPLLAEEPQIAERRTLGM